MINEEVMHIFGLFYINNDIIGGYTIHYNFPKKIDDCPDTANGQLNNVDHKAIRTPLSIFTRLSALADYIEKKIDKLKGESNSCVEIASKILNEGYFYENFRTDRIDLRKELRAGNISIVEYQKTLFSKKREYEETTQSIIQAFEPFFDAVFKYIEEDIFIRIPHLSNMQNILRQQN